MKKVAIFSYYFGVVDRGVETFTYEITKRLNSKYDITVFTSGSYKSKDVKTIKIKSSPQIPKETAGIIGKFYLDKQSLKILLFSLKAIPEILKGKYKVLILTNGGWQVFIYRIISKISGAKILISGHAGIGSDDAWNLFFRPDIFIALTKAQFNWAKKLAPEVPIILIPNGVDLSRFNPQVEAERIALKKPVVVCSSALVPYKRVDLTVRAVAKTQNLSLLVLGDGQMKGTIDGLGKRLLGDRYLRLTVPYGKIPGFYRAGDVFSLASETEAFGIAYLEAMACNLPVVTTNDRSRLEIIGDAGILTDPQNLNQYAKDLKIAASSNYKNRPYNQALKFSWNTVSGKYSQVINHLLK